MSFIKELCFSICVSLIVAVTFSVFTPRGSMKGFYKILISLFVFISFVYPFRDFNLNSLALSDVKLKYSDNEYSKPYESLVEKEVKDVLRDDGIIGVSVSSDVEVDYDTGEVEIKSVRIAISSDYDKNEVKKTVFEKLGIDAEVVGIGE